MVDICKIEGCDAIARSRGWCYKHYSRFRKYGDPLTMRRATPNKNPPAVCQFDGCARKPVSKSYCQKHYSRVWRHGDVNVVLRAANGECMNWIHAHTSYQGDECLIWPYASGGNGDAVVLFDGGMRSASRVMCILVHGEPPEPSYHAAHNCGKGHLGCMNPSHLRWDTINGNFADKVLHGTQTRGSSHPMAKLSEDQAIYALNSPKGPSEVAMELGVSHALISRIRSGKVWAHLERCQTHGH